MFLDPRRGRIFHISRFALGEIFFRTLLSNVMKSVINGKFVGNDFRWHLEVHERPCGCQDSSPRIFTSLYGGEPHIKGSRSSK